MFGERLQFSLSATSTAVAAADPCEYTVCLAPLELQVSALYLLVEHFMKENNTLLFFFEVFNTEVSEEQSYVLQQSLQFSSMGGFIKHDVLLPSIGCLLMASLD